jgi:hypothetical protein
MCTATTGKTRAGIRPLYGQKAGRITATGMMKEVAFKPVKGAINDRIDEAYRAKYARNPYLAPMIGARARAATVKIVPHGTAA